LPRDPGDELMLYPTLNRLRRRHGRRPSRAILAGIGLPTFLVVMGPGLLAGLSDDDPAGITTYSVAGARYGYELLWVLILPSGRSSCTTSWVRGLE
jgi:hypothetical protein